jgi:hypothetical protein
LPLYAIGVIVIFLPVCFLQNSIASNACLILACLFLFRPAQVLGIDSIEITAGHVQLDTYELSDLKAELVPAQASQLNLDVGFNLSGRPLQLTGHIRNKDWQLNTVINASIPSLLEDYRQLAPEFSVWPVTGDVSLKLAAEGNLDTVQQQLRYQVSATNLTGELPEQATAFEGLNIAATGKARIMPSAISGDIQLSYRSGLLAYGDLLLEPVAGAIELRTDFSISEHKIKLKQFQLNDPGGLVVDVPAAIFDRAEPAKQHELTLNVDARKLRHVYKSWVQPLLYASPMADIEVEGKLISEINVRNAQIQQLNLKVTDASMADRAGRFSLYNVSVLADGKDQFDHGSVKLRWENAELYQLLAGSSEIEFVINEQDVFIDKSFNIPIYDGELKVFQLSLENLRGADPTVTFDGILTPVSLSSLSDAMGWPPLTGSISGVIPSVRYDKEGLKVDGVLLARAFDGTFKIEHLQLSDLFGPLPRLSADFSVQQLDLDQLTRTFDFGRIEGKMSGYIAGLEMVAWQAQSFDAFFFTPEDDKGRHIISQKAVDNITSLSGSDIGSVLSRSYLKFFENFRYERLGIGCRLRNNVCLMNGIEAAGGASYYIVKGGLLPPRLHIIGYSHEVDWPDLVSRLERVMSDNAPVIQ